MLPSMNPLIPRRQSSAKDALKCALLLGIFVNCATLSRAASPPGDVVGKVTVGYQGWFSAAGDGSPVNAWGHSNLEMWPDVRAFVTTYSGCPFLQDGVRNSQGNFTGNLGNGKPATMFSSYDQQVVNTHLSWMAQSGIDCCALQRFGNEISPGSTLKAQRDGMALKVMSAAQTYGVKFYIMYDSSATDAIQSDWTDTIVSSLHLTSSPNYARQNGKPVVCLYGVCQSGRGTPTDWQTRINWFKSQGCYVIGGCAGFSPSNPANTPAYTALNMILPWRVGALGGLASFQTSDANDLSFCNANNIDYQACIYPGTAFANTNGQSVSPRNQIPRNHGDFMWGQFAGAKNAGVVSGYIAMFDELNEATSIFKVAEDSSMIPANNYFLTLDADGVHCSSDFYLRLVNNGGKMLKGTIPFQAIHTTQFVVPRYEVENLTVANFLSAAGGTVRSMGPDVSLSNGDGKILDSNNAGDYMTFVMPNIAAGSYNVKIGIKPNSSRGQFQLQIGTAANFSGTETSVGPVIDEYAAGPAYTDVDLGTWTPGTTSDKWFRFLVTGKNSASGGSSFNNSIAVDYIMLQPLPQVQGFQAESLSATGSSGVTVSLQTDAAASGGQWSLASTSAVGQAVTYTIPSGLAANVTYDVTIGFKANANRGAFQLSVDGVNHGSPVDEYASSASYKAADIGTFVANSSASHTFTFTCTGKNNSATSFECSIDYLTLTARAIGN